MLLSPFAVTGDCKPVLPTGSEVLWTNCSRQTAALRLQKYLSQCRGAGCPLASEIADAWHLEAETTKYEAKDFLQTPWLEARHSVPNDTEKAPMRLHLVIG